MSQNPNDQEELPLIVRAQHANEMLEEGLVDTLAEAAKMNNIKRTTLGHYLKGRPMRCQVNHKLQKLTPEEEKTVILRCELLGKWGFPPEIWKVKEIAQIIANERDPTIKVERRWFELFRKRHTILRTVYSNQLDYIRAVRGDNLKILNDFFDMYEEVTQEFSLKPQNTYNVDEIGFLLGHIQSSKVLEVIRNPREKGKLFRNQG